MNNYIKISIFFVFCFLEIKSMCQVAQDVENILNYIKTTVVSIGIVIPIKNGKDTIKKFVPVGSGLIAYLRLNDGCIVDVITAGHVIKYFRNNNKNIFIRPTKSDTIKTTDYFGLEITLMNSDGFPNTYLYPENNIDLGCIIITYDQSNEKNNEMIKSIEPIRYNQMKKPYLGEQVWICGYPSHIENNILQSNYNISTFKPGYISWIPFKNMTNPDLNHIILIESNATFGNSGSPVYAIRENLRRDSINNYLVGIQSSIYQEIDSLYFKNTPLIDSSNKEPYLIKSKSGVSIIEKAEYVYKLNKCVEKQVIEYKKINKK